MTTYEHEKDARYLQQLYQLEECKRMLSQVMVFLLDETTITHHQRPQPTAKAPLYRVK